MAVMILSIIISAILGAIAWLIVGDRFPLAGDTKLPPLNNIVIYSGLALIPVYFLIFYIFK